VRVAVVIAARDVAPFIGAAVGSVLGQSHSDLSLTVVDDGSSDETAAIVGGFPDGRLRLVRQTNHGTSATRNRGAQDAGKADAFLFLDGDDWLAPDAVSRLVGALKSDPAAVAAHAPFAFVGENATATAPGPLDRRQAPRTRDLLPRLVVGNVFANGGHVLIRAAAWRAAGPFSTALSYGEDWEFWLRLALQGPFAAIGGAPALFVRRRAGSKMHGGATLPQTYRPVLEAIRANPAIAARLGGRRFGSLCRRAEAEFAWTMGRELLRRGQVREAWAPLRRGMFGRPRPLRLVLLAMVAMRRLKQKS
jgi:glycosyltransferase involved in cell wall biosynthesis